MMKTIVFKIIIILIFSAFIFGCSEKYAKIDEDKFIGLWELKGRDIFEGVQIKIEKEGEKLVGRILRLNNNKLVKIFADSNDVWVSEIIRTSNFEFKLNEKKIAKDLFSLYGLSTNQEYKAQFIDENTIGLANGDSSPQKSSVTYKRIK